MGMETCGDGLKTRLNTITSLKQILAPKELAETINGFPAALILPAPFNYDADFSGNQDYNFRIILLFAKADLPSAVDDMLDYMETSGTKSVKAALEAEKTLGAVADDLKVVRNTGVGFTEWGGIQYLSTEFEIIVYA